MGSNDQQERGAERRSVTVHTECRIDGRSVMVTVHDLSETGCQLEGFAGWADEGSRVILKIGGFNCPPGHVVWAKNRRGGVKFDGRLHPAVVDQVTR